MLDAFFRRALENDSTCQHSAMSLLGLALRVLRSFKLSLESGHYSIQDTRRAGRHYAEQRTT
jgi:hypothetical protein